MHVEERFIWLLGTDEGWAELSELHAEPHRHYHNLKHVSAMLETFSSLRVLCKHPNDVELAILYHDAIYDPRARDNEERSADLAARHLAGRAGTERIQRIRALILTTKHTVPASDPDTAVLVDCDLAILGQAPEVFDTYEINIRREYDWVPEADFRAGRTAVLKSFLGRERIYRTGPCFTAFEQSARINLQRSIDALSTR